MTIQELAKLCGVSASTVSKVLNHSDESISEATRQHIQSLAEEYNYRPYAFVQRQYIGKSNLIGIIFKEEILDDRLLKGLMNEARAHGYGITVLESHGNLKQEEKNLDLLLSGNADGILLQSIQERLSDRIQCKLKDWKKPFCLFQNKSEKSIENDLPSVPYQSMAKYLTEKLIKAGHSHIALIANKKYPFFASFQSGFKTALYEHSLPFSERLIYENDNERFYRNVSSGSISAVLNLHFQDAFHVYQRLENRHILVPEDISIITLCKHESNFHNFPALSALLIPFEEYGEFLCKQIIHKIKQDISSTIKSHNVYEGENRNAKTKEKKKVHAAESTQFLPQFHLNHEKTISPPVKSKKKKILVLGSVNIDSYLFFRTLPSSGMAMRTTRSATYLGGKGMNQAIGVSNLGHKGFIIGLVGDDLEADNIYEIAKEKGVNTEYLKRMHREKTGKGYIFLNNDGESMISILSGANECFSTEHVNSASNAFQDSVFCLINTEIPEDSVLAACRLAKKNLVPVILKPSSIRKINQEILSLTDIFVPNLEEAQTLLSEELPEFSAALQKIQEIDADAFTKKMYKKYDSSMSNSDKEVEKWNTVLSGTVDFFLKKGVGMTIITLGEKGLFVKGTGLCTYYPAHKVTTNDTTGAADAFISAFASYLALDYPIDTAIRIAIYAAALSTTIEGAAPSLVNKNTLEAYIMKEAPALLLPNPK